MPSTDKQMEANQDLRLLNKLRVRVVHQSSLLPASSMFVGYLKYRKPKLGFKVNLDPLTDTLPALVRARQVLAKFAHPHRMWVGEELGIQRRWSLQEIEGRELVGFCITSWKTLSEIIAAA